jgi:hypothetical protein
MCVCARHTLSAGCAQAAAARGGLWCRQRLQAQQVRVVAVAVRARVIAPRESHELLRAPRCAARVLCVRAAALACAHISVGRAAGHCCLPLPSHALCAVRCAVCARRPMFGHSIVLLALQKPGHKNFFTVVRPNTGACGRLCVGGSCRCAVVRPAAARASPHALHTSHLTLLTLITRRTTRAAQASQRLTWSGPTLTASTCAWTLRPPR